MKNKKGFTLIELLAVIIILGILMIIAVPAVTKYINDSRKKSYITIAGNITSGVRTIVNSGKYNMTDKNTTYYIPAEYVKTENGFKSPYGEFTEAYVGVIAIDDYFNYYWISRDEAGVGVSSLIPVDKLDVDDLKENIPEDDVTAKIRSTGIGNRTTIKLLKSDGSWETITLADTSNNITEGGALLSGLVCMKASSLHHATCEGNGNDCSASIGAGNTITYGTIPGSTLKAGDAFDCDVNNDGVYNSTNERFYYLESSGENSTLIYYANYGSEPNLAYYENDENWRGPISGYLQLPSTSEWNNDKLVAPGTRQIKNELGGNTTDGGTIESFTYTNRAARLLTYQEVRNVCDVPGMISVSYPGYLEKCNYLLENTLYEGTGPMAYWLETPDSSRDSYVFFVLSHIRLLSSGNAYTTLNGFRPVITVKTSDIES